MFVALTERGIPLWRSTLSTTAEEAQELHDKHNPDPTGQGMNAQVSKVVIKVKP